MKITALFIAAAIAVASTASAQTVQKLSAVKANDYGLAYTLPTTAIDITIEEQIVTSTPGEFYKYASKYLNIDNPIAQPSTKTSLRNVVITTSGIPDPERRFLVTLKSGQSPYIVLTPDNIPLAVNTEEAYHVDTPVLPVAVAAEPTPLETPAARQVITQEMLQSHSSAKRAELAAEQIYALRQSRTDLITGQADRMPPDGAAMQLALDNINAQEAALMAMFVGTQKVETVVRTFTFVPDGDVTNYVIGRISPTGIVDPTDLSGAPVYLSVKITQEGELPVNARGETIPFPKGGVAYCIPGQAQVTVSYDGRNVASSSVALAQAGVVYGMNPSNFTDKKEQIFLQFDPATGAAAQIGPANR